MPIRRLIVVFLTIGVLAAACSTDGSTDASEETVTEDTTAQDVPTPEATTTTGATTTAPDDGNTEPLGSLTAQDGDLVEVHYVGTLDDGSQFDSSRDRGTPFSFTVGTGEVISGFDEAVRGASVGDINTVRMEAADAYGDWSEENIIEVPYNPEQGDIAVGDQVYLTNGQPAVILEITDETVTLDANHALAGEALTFEIEVLAITRG
ncbi:MAG: FKBP-type peptidyl-prolyl cis-trans isomerase [Acidimicrobiia bacterium]